jgi:HEAT repeat protein
MIEYVTAADLAAIKTIFAEGDEEARLAAVRRMAHQPESPEDREAVLEALIQVMGDESWQVRKEAVAAVLNWTDAELLAERLVDAMSEPEDIGRRNAVIEAVMKLGPVTIDPLLRALHRKPDYRKVLVDVLGTFGDTRVIPALGESLLDEDPNVRAAAMEQLASFQSHEVVPALRQALRSPDLLVVLAALDGLNRQKVALPTADLLPLCEQAVLRPALMTALGHSQDQAAVPALVAGLVEKARGAREAALVGLFRLYNSLDQFGQQLIEEAARKLDEMAVRSSLRALMEATPPVRQATAALIGWTGRREMLRPLLLGLGDVDPSVVDTTGRAILQMGEPALVSLCELVPTLDARSRGSVFRFFLRQSSVLFAMQLRERITGLLETGLGDKNPQTAAAAASALAVYSLPRLRELAQGSGPSAELAKSTLNKLSERPPATAPTAVPATKEA